MASRLTKLSDDVQWGAVCTATAAVYVWPLALLVPAHLGLLALLEAAMAVEDVWAIAKWRPLVDEESEAGAMGNRGGEG